MKTICALDGRIIMSQDGDATESMQKNAAQYAGSSVAVIDDSEFDLLITRQTEKDHSAEKQANAERIDKLFPGITEAQRDFFVEIIGGRK